MSAIHDLPVMLADGSTGDMGRWRGRVLLIVNTASGCGFTPQYAGLEALHRRHAAAGLSVVGVPCNQFGAQEPGTAEDIASFCSLPYDVTFPVLGKVDVNGAGAAPLFRFLKAAAPGLLGSERIKWNFTKFLVDCEGRVVSRHAPTTRPEAIEADILRLL